MTYEMEQVVGIEPTIWLPIKAYETSFQPENHLQIRLSA